jgi:hypothetical protein
MARRRATKAKIAKRQAARNAINERNSRNPNYVNYRGKYLRPEKVAELAAIQMLFYGKNTPHYKDDPSYFWAIDIKNKRRLKSNNA